MAIYSIFLLDPDGDSYALFNTLEEAKEEFEIKVETFKEFEEMSLVLGEVTNPKDFGFGARGDVFGMEVIESHNWE